MSEYWESKFKSGGTMWHFHPSDSAIKITALFKSKGFKQILIPGFGYGRNAKTFIEKGFNVTGIEISGSAIALARENGISCDIHHGSVTAMPFDSKIYDGIFCYALIHLLNSKERKSFLSSCFSQLAPGGSMIFIVTSVKNSLYGSGKYLSKDRYQIPDGLKVFFYDEESILKEFGPYGLESFEEMEEPVKFIEGLEPLRMFSVTCKK
jgi:cyclopropane fatty-acyl-phospholipid synthase-like methyltransferase